MKALAKHILLNGRALGAIIYGTALVWGAYYCWETIARAIN